MSKQGALALFWTLFILLICWIPGRYVQPGVEPGGFSLGELHFDKVAHLGIFAILGYALARTNRLRQRPGWIISIGAAVAAISEVGQGVLPTGRTADLADFLADLAGVVLGLWIYRRLHRTRTARSVEAKAEDEDKVELSVRD